MYQLLLFLHILSGITWVGGAFFVQVLAFRVSHSDDPTELPSLARNTEVLGKRLFMPAAFGVIITGVLMVLQQWSFGQLWIALAVALWVLSALLGAVYIGPRLGKVSKLFDTEGPESASGRALLQRLFLVSRLELLSFVVIVAMMVFKPGS